MMEYLHAKHSAYSAAKCSHCEKRLFAYAARTLLGLCFIYAHHKEQYKAHYAKICDDDCEQSFFVHIIHPRRYRLIYLRCLDTRGKSAAPSGRKQYQARRAAAGEDCPTCRIFPCLQLRSLCAPLRPV